MTIRHIPHGSGHPYRYDLDQRVPTDPLLGEPFEIRAVSDSHTHAVQVLFSDGRTVQASPVEVEDLIQDHGPPPSAATADGHLAAAAESSSVGSDVQVWRVVATVDSSQQYRISAVSDAGETELGPFAVEPSQWSPEGGTLTVTGTDSRLDTDSVRWLMNTNGPIRVRFRLRLDPGQHISGLGERYEAIDHRGEVLDAVVFEQYKHQGHRTYLPAPMAVVVGGEHWGFHIDSTHRTWFDFGVEEVDWIIVEAELAPSNPVLDIGIWDGTPPMIVRHFLERTGQPRLAPDWVFEPWMSGNEWNTQARVEQEVSRSIEEGVAVGVIVIEAWSDESTFVAFRDATYDAHQNGEPHRLEDFTFPADGAWPDPAGMVERLHQQGVKVLLWQIPLIPTDRGNDGQVKADLRSIEALGYCVQDSDGSPHRNRGWWFPSALLPDFTNPKARSWWANKRRYLLEQIGIDGFKTDGGEHLWGHDLLFADGTKGAESNNRFALLFSQTFHELMDDVGVEGVTFSRAGFAGSASYPCHWAGDEDSTWEGFEASIRAGLNAGIAGINYWGWDLAGFSGDIPEPELFLRSTAMATFSPIMQYHSEFNHHRKPNVDRTPWNIAERWNDPTVLETYRAFSQLRRRLVPYLSQQVRKSIISGRPLMRPMFFDYPDDDETWSVPLQYQLGDELIVAPITKPDTNEIEAYLPAGEWINCHSGEKHTGPEWTTCRVGLDTIAAFRKAQETPSLLPSLDQP